MTIKQWNLGDKVVHASKPEWGVGEVRSCEAINHNGTQAQRVTVRFDRAGVKTLSTVYADLRAVGADFAIPESATPSEEGEGSAELLRRMTELPDAATDPFRSRRARMDATLKLYRFAGTGASLLDWAAAQSGLKDPLSRFNRHELEQFFERFRVGLDNHLKRLAQELRREDPGALAELAVAAPAAAQQALKRLDLAR